jgi:hypothetical protein
MKRYILLFALFTITQLGAQNISTYGLLGNAGNLIQNPGADPLTKFQLSFGAQGTFGISSTAGELFASSDVLGNLLAANTDDFSLNGLVGLNLPHVGFKIHDHYFFGGVNIDVDFGLVVDRDLLLFARNGMADANGDLDLDYAGDFSDSGARLSVSSRSYLGYQRSLLDNSLRIGITLNRHNYLAGLDVSTNTLGLNSNPSAGTFNQVSAQYDIDIASTNLFSTTSSIDSLADLKPTNLKDYNTLGDITSGESQNSLGFGVTYKPLKALELQLSMSGIGGTSLSFDSQLAKNMSGSSTINGFNYTSAPGDTISNELSNAIDQFTDEATGGITTALSNSSYTQTFNITKNANAAVNYYFAERSYLGVHYTSRSNTYSDYQYTGLNSMVWVGKYLQLKGGYYWSMSEVNTNFVNVAIQFRVTPLLQVYLGTNTISDIATAVSGTASNGNLTLASDTKGVNFSAGVSFTSFDKRFKLEKEARKLKRAESKATQATSLSPADQQKVDRASENSSTKK